MNSKKTIITGGILTVIIIASLIIIGYYRDFRVESDTSLFTLSASTQAFAAILVLSLIVIYNQMQFIDRLIKETENRIFDYMNEVIGWFYPAWEGTPIKKHINANINESGFTNTYFKIQLIRHISPKLTWIRKPEKRKDVILSSIEWNMKDNNGVDENKTAEKLVENYFHFVINTDGLNRTDFKNEIENEIVNRIKEVHEQQNRLKRGEEKRKQYKKEYELMTKEMKKPLIIMILVVFFSLIVLALQGQSGRNLPLQGYENTIAIIIILGLGIYSLSWLIIHMYNLIRKHKDIQILHDSEQNTDF